MRQPEPAWYADLRDEPLRVRMFTPELADRIRREAVRNAKEMKAAPYRRMALLGAAACCLAAVLLIAVRQDRFSLPGVVIGNSGSSGISTVDQGGSVSAEGGGQDVLAGSPQAPAETDGAGTPQGHTGADEREQPGADGGEAPKDREKAESGGEGAAEGSANQDKDSLLQYADSGKITILKVAEPTLDEWQLLIDALKPGRESVVLEVEEVEGSQKRRLILSRKLTAADGTLRGDVRVDEVEWGVNGWRNGTSVWYTPEENLLDTDARVLISTFGIGPHDSSIDIFMGFLLDPDIVSMRVRDERDEVYEAKLFPEENGLRIWYARTPEQPRSNITWIEGLDANGNVIYEQKLIGPPDVIRYVPEMMPDDAGLNSDQAE